jgi:xanthine dehydrogenase molybdopterin-binding subunit B
MQVATGEFRIGGQEHFYLETMACTCSPVESGGMHIVSSTQV